VTEQTKGIMATVSIVACLALLAFLVHEKVDNASMAAIAAVTTLVAWVTRPPNRTDPPTGASLVPLAALGAIVSSLFSVGCLSASEKAIAAEAAYREQQSACVRQYDTEALILACRAKVRAEWGITETVTAKDGGR
jgi:hypothetical protein